MRKSTTNEEKREVIDFFPRANTPKNVAKRIRKYIEKYLDQNLKMKIKLVD